MGTCNGLVWGGYRKRVDLEENASSGVTGFRLEEGYRWNRVESCVREGKAEKLCEKMYVSPVMGVRGKKPTRTFHS